MNRLRRHKVFKSRKLTYLLLIFSRMIISNTNIWFCSFHFYLHRLSSLYTWYNFYIFTKNTLPKESKNFKRRKMFKEVFNKFCWKEKMNEENNLKYIFPLWIYYKNIYFFILPKVQNLIITKITFLNKTNV